MVAQAAGYNLCELLQQDGVRDRDLNLAPELKFEDYAPDGYNDDAYPVATAKSIVETLPKALKGDTRDLDELTDRIFATRLGVSKIPIVQEHVLDSLFKVSETRED